MASQFDVVVVGAGAAGLTAAIGLARAGFTVAAVEAAAYPGAENWSGCVYFAENLAHPDVLGPDGVEALAWERRLVERGFFGCDGHGLLGMTYRDPAAFRHCYTVLRPIYDHHLAQVALGLGVALLSATTAESLIRDGGRVVGVCTQRGPVYADLVFLAEGDASHLVTREGYERFTDQREAPKFLHGIKQVIDMPAGAIEEIFGVGPEEGVAYEMLLRNGTLAGRPVRLNMGGFLYTNRQSLSVGLVLPADNLHDHFGGDPNLLIEWFENLPALRPWLRGGKRGVFGAKLIRGGGAKDIPHLIDHGLAIGGAASAIGIDFPYPNFTGPATAMGLLLTRAVCRIRAEGGGFTRDALRRHYLEPLQRTHYWRDVEFLRRWPGYVKKTHVFFGPNLDLALGTAYVWTRPDRGFLRRWTSWLRLLADVAGPGEWRTLLADLRHLVRALRLREVLSRPALGQLALDGTLNALRDLGRHPRAHVPPAGTLRVRYSVAGGAEPAGPAPRFLRGWFRRFGPVLAAAAGRVYANDDTPLSAKLPGAVQLMLRQINVLDLLAGGTFALATGLYGGLLLGWDRLVRAVRRGRPARAVRRLHARYALAAQRATDLTASVGPANQNWEDRLGRLAYHTIKASHIHVLWPRSLPDRNAVAQKGLWHVCPAHVYEARVSPQGQLQIVVNYENCIKCETCWRTSDLVDWGRDGLHRFIYPVVSPANVRLLTAVDAAGMAMPRLLASPKQSPERLSEPRASARGQPAPLADARGSDAGEVPQLRSLAERLERKLEEFDAALAQEPRTIDRARAEHLESLARYAQQLAVSLLDSVRASSLAAQPQVLELATALAARADERARRTWDQRFAWAAADGRQLRFHHLAGLRGAFDEVAGPAAAPAAEDPSRAWLRAEADTAAVADMLAGWRKRLDAVFAPSAWRDLDRQAPLTPAQDEVLRALLAEIPEPALGGPLPGLHPPERKALLAELGRRDPSLAYRVACHLWARDLARLVAPNSSLAAAAERWARGEEWAAFAAVQALQTATAGWMGEVLFVPAQGAGSLLLLLGDQLAVVPADCPGLHVDPLATLGLRGAGLARVRLDDLQPPEARTGVDHDRVERVWRVLSAADLTSIAFGMADQLCLRAVAHATTRVQFPGLFHDERARDPIAKFGAVKKMIADMAARRYLLETLDHVLTPGDFSAPSAERAELVKALAATALGTAPGSLSYNAGQVFGGTGYSEDDILAKFYRDAAAWRFLGPDNAEVHHRHGDRLLRGWRPDGSRLAGVADEAVLFDQLAQRQALQAELDEIRVHRSRLRSLVNDWQTAKREHLADGGNGTPGGSATPEVGELLSQQDAHLLAGKALLLRTHARLEHGLNAEVETALLRVWLEGTSAALDEFEAGLRRLLDAPGRPEARPVVDPAAGPPVTLYADYLAAPCPYDSGDFLGTPPDPVQPRLVPEMVESDPALAAANRELCATLAGHFGKPHGDGLPYERYVERRHRPDAEDLDLCRRHGFFRMIIPRDLGGEGRRKLEYYLLTVGAQRLADVAIALTIQVNTSLGTTPITVARDRDLPKAQKDLGPFVADPAVREEVRLGLEKLLQLVAIPDARRIGQLTPDLDKRLKESVFGRPALKALAGRFAGAWQQATRAGQQQDLAGMETHLPVAQGHWKEVCARAEELHGELGRRREACDLFLRWIASGQISGFALTEPSAGSDTARVATRARLRSVPVEVEADGVLRFVPAGGTAPRYLLDARRLEFRAEGPCYRWSDAAAPAPIRFDEYDYETDDPQRTRYYDHGDRRVHFTDIAQLRERDGRPWYDYWELTGAKMWITNGRMAGVFCLYAKTEEGVTGFLVDRHAEGLIVGKDEDKVGQCGSPTNELALQAVRVPRENVLGLEGRGQVNALETLNVGRAGLAMTAMAQMDGLIEHSRAFARATHGDVPDWVAWRLRRMEEDRFTAEALAFDVIGRFEHPQTKSVRMESAVSKLLVTELLHRVIEYAEEIHGLAGQTQLHLVEKRKRDARVLTIYEGTNEIQRFLLLKDLAGEVAPRWAAKPGGLSGYVGREGLEQEALRGELRQRVTAALEFLGQDLWQNPNLQANCFLLAEAVAWFKAADSTLGRLAWLDRLAHADENAEPPAKVATGRGALAACQAEVRNRLRRFDEELARLRRGYYAPEVRAASLLFDRAADTPPPRPVSTITLPLSVLVVVEPSAAEVPQPHVAGGQLLDAHLTLTAADRAALETALRLRDAGGAVTIQVAAVGSRGCGQVLREVLSLGVDRARLLMTEAAAVTPDAAAAGLAAVLRGERFDLLLGGAGPADGADGTVALLTAAALDLPPAGRTAQLAVRATDSEAQVLLLAADGQGQRVRSLPAAVTVEAGLTLRPFSVQGYLDGLAKTLTAESWPAGATPRAVQFLEGEQTATAGSAEQPTGPLTPQDAARRVLGEIGLDGARSAPQEVFSGPLDDVAQPDLTHAGVVAVLAAEADGRLAPTARPVVQAARLLADDPATVPALVLVPDAEEAQRRAAGQVLALGQPRVVLVTAPRGESSPEVRSRLLRECWPGLRMTQGVVVGEPWADPAFAALGQREGQASLIALRVRRLVREKGEVVLETAGAGGKLRVRQAVPEDTPRPWWITLTEGAEVEGGCGEPVGTGGHVQRWSPRLERFYGRDDVQRLLTELKQETGLPNLADAEFIIDVGYGVGNQDGYEAVIEPLERALRGLGVRGLAVGGSRKVTEELHVLPVDRQIGQSGVSVNPQVLLAIGVSGAPQHLNYIGPRATVVAFNRDPEAPIMTLNQRQPRPRVFPVVGDLFETVPALTAALDRERAPEAG
jgi:alkylation response protein AidB-like acyl-CoA dehydrogenase/flavin-dependent dehydrogenase/electron transfer flavoprotein alpha/beta subunit/ferredoxin-like protein FixX